MRKSIWKSATMNEKIEAVWNVLIQYPSGLLTTEIAEKTEMSYPTVSKVFEVLYVLGKVKFRQVGRGRFIKPVLDKKEQKERGAEFKENFEKEFTKEEKDEPKAEDTEMEEGNPQEQDSQIQEETKTISESRED